MSRGGATTALVVEGEPGIGKTTLLEAAERMATGFRRLWVRGAESESVLAHAGLLQALGPVRDELAEIPGAQATALSSALGWGAVAAPAERFLVAGAVLSMLAALSQRAPVLVLVDDLQWVDQESAAALAFAARRLRDDRVCFVWAARTGSIQPDFAPGVPVLTLAGLSDADAVALVPDRVADGVVSVWSRTPAATRSGFSRSPAASRGPSERVPRRFPTRCPSATAWRWCTSSSSASCRHRLGAPCCCPRSTVPARRPRWPSRWPGTGRTWPPRWTRLRIAACWCAAARSSASAIPLLRTVGAGDGDRRPRQRAAHRALAEVLADDPHSLAGTWHRAEAAAGPDPQLAATSCVPRTRAACRHGYAAASAAMEQAALLADDPR